MGGMVAMNLIDDMFWNWRHPVGWGWGGGYGGGWGNTYNFYPEHDHYRDYYSGQAAGGADFSDIDRTDTAAGTDFLGSTGGDTGGADFGSDRS